MVHICTISDQTVCYSNFKVTLKSEKCGHATLNIYMAIDSSICKYPLLQKGPNYYHTVKDSEEKTMILQGIEWSSCW